MTRHLLDRGRRRVAQRLARRAGDDRGFILLESIIAISLVTIIMGALGAEYVTDLLTTSHQRAEKVAVQLADTAVEGLRALHPSDLLTGRDRTSVVTERNALTAIPAVSSWIASSSGVLAYDLSASSGGSSATVPTTAVTQTPGTTPFSVWEYLDCNTTATSGSCLSTSSGVNFIRATVAVVLDPAGLRRRHLCLCHLDPDQRRRRPDVPGQPDAPRRTDRQQPG